MHRTAPAYRRPNPLCRSWGMGVIYHSGFLPRRRILSRGRPCRHAKPRRTGRATAIPRCPCPCRRARAFPRPGAPAVRRHGAKLITRRHLPIQFSLAARIAFTPVNAYARRGVPLASRNLSAPAPSRGPVFGTPLQVSFSLVGRWSLYFHLFH
jgi:hypothetical protein